MFIHGPRKFKHYPPYPPFATTHLGKLVSVRSLLLFLSGLSWLRHWIETSSVTSRLTSR